MSINIGFEQDFLIQKTHKLTVLNAHEIKNKNKRIIKDGIEE